MQPASLLTWGVLAIVMGVYAVGIDRTFLLDDSNYLDNFAAGPTLEWLRRIAPEDSQRLGLIAGVFSEEALWQVWTTLLGSVFTPPTAVVLTVCVLNLLIASAVTRLANPALALIIWMVVPVGFAVTGLLQLRQGFAFAVMLYFALRMNRPVLGTLMAAMIHTTFALALPFVLIAWLCGRQRLVALLLTVGLAGAAAYLGGVLFEAFGGRRLHTYDVNSSEATSIMYVFGGMLCSLPSLHRLLSAPVSGETAVASRSLDNLAIIHVGVIAFTAISFFVFPLGAGRVGYLTMLLLIPILATSRPREGLSGMLIFALLVLYLIYLAVKTSLEGTYDIYVAG
jgi:hypothetical protein